jgi:hypothetical protein
MMRFAMVVSTLTLCFILTGCQGDTHEGSIERVVQAMDTAGAEISAINKKVTDAVKKVEEGANSLDLTEAMKSTEGLKKVSVAFQTIKRDIEQTRTSITDEQKKEYAKKAEPKVNSAFKGLLTKREQLRKSLEQAETINGGAFKLKVAELRKKITEAEGPFESIARQ